MRKWEITLTRDTEAYDDLDSWLSGIFTRELDKLRRVAAADHERQAGVVEGIERVLFLVRANRKERLSSASIKPVQS